ncbi:MAG TPA: T9SS type A sorting domain-containing protein [Ohtaekwangia sp.]|nr:T9SS type A sorting domain-containing protein [Ohtaekwangia sp.]
METAGDIGDYIYQFDLSNPSIKAIRDSKLPLFSTNNSVTNIGKYSATLAAGMQIGPDGRIYIAGNISTLDGTGSLTIMKRNALIVIERPNIRGFDCYITLKFFDFGQGKVFPGLPNFVQNTFNMRVPNRERTPCDANQAYSVFPNPAKDYIKIRIPQECFQPYHFALYNNLGQLIKEGFVYTRESELIDVRRLSDGLYLVYFRQLNKTVLKKILKTNK